MAEHALIGPPSRAWTFRVRKKFGWTVLEQCIGYAHSEVDGGSWFIEPVSLTLPLVLHVIRLDLTQLQGFYGSSFIFQMFIFVAPQFWSKASK